MTNDMTTGNPVKLILLFSIPLLIGNIFQQFIVWLIQLLLKICRRSISSSRNNRFHGVLVNGFMGLQWICSTISQKYGVKMKRVKKAVASSITLSIIATIIVTFISVISAKPLNLMNTPSNIMKDASTYIIILYAGNVAIYSII